MLKFKQILLLQLKIVGKQNDIEEIIEKLQTFYEVKKVSNFIETGQFENLDYTYEIWVNVFEKIKALGDDGREW